jgi:hypothetical protein
VTFQNQKVASHMHAQTRQHVAAYTKRRVPSSYAVLPLQHGNDAASLVEDEAVQRLPDDDGLFFPGADECLSTGLCACVKGDRREDDCQQRDETDTEMHAALTEQIMYPGAATV